MQASLISGRITTEHPLVSGRSAGIFAGCALVLQAAATFAYFAAAGFSGHLSADPLTLLASGPNGAALIHWGSLIDMLGYLALAPVILYLRGRYPAAKGRDLFAAAGLALIIIGAIGAVSMATAAPSMINAYTAAGTAQREALFPAFNLLYRSVVLGMWQTLETIPAAVWLLGNATAARRDGPRAVFFILLVLGIGNASICFYRLLTG